MEAAIQKNTNDELKMLQLKLSILEEELRKALARADSAESELEKYKSSDPKAIQAAAALVGPSLPPPPPPPMPANLLYKPSNTLIIPSRNPNESNEAGGSRDSTKSFSDSIALSNLHSGSGVGGAGSGNKVIDCVKQQVRPEAATGRFCLLLCVSV